MRRRKIARLGIELLLGGVKVASARHPHEHDLVFRRGEFQIRARVTARGSPLPGVDGVIAPHARAFQARRVLAERAEGI
jgi:hypothetical protein